MKQPILVPVLRLPFGKGRLLWTPDNGEAIRPGGLAFETRLQALLFKHGVPVDEFDFGSGVVTTAGVVYGAADMAGGASDISAFNYHDCGTGTGGAVIGDTALGTPWGGSRQSGTQSTPGNTNIYQTVATITFTNTFAITEWGLFSAAASGTLWDRRVFTAINVVNNDSIQFTYQLTWTAGG